MSRLPSSLSSLSILEHELEEELKNLTVPLSKQMAQSKIPQPRARIPTLRTRKDIPPVGLSSEKPRDDDQFLSALGRYAEKGKIPIKLRQDGRFQRVYERLVASAKSVINYEHPRRDHTLSSDRLIEALNKMDLAHLRVPPAVSKGRPLFFCESPTSSLASLSKLDKTVEVVIEGVDVNLKGVTSLALLVTRDGEDYREAATLPSRLSQRVVPGDTTKTYRMTCDEAEWYRIVILDRGALVAMSGALSGDRRVKFTDNSENTVGYATVRVLKGRTSYWLSVTVLAMSLHRKNFAPLGDLWPLLCVNGEDPVDVMKSGTSGRRVSMSRVANSAELRSKAVEIESRDPFTSFAIFAITNDEEVIGGTEELLIDDDDYNCDERTVEVYLFDNACEGRIGLASLRVKIEKRLNGP